MTHLKSRRSGQDLRNHPEVLAAEGRLPPPPESGAEFLAKCWDHLKEKPSTSYLQRKMQIGYNRAAGIVEWYEARGWLSEPNSAGVRTVLHQH